jgi:hypothetical protein
MSYNLSQPPGRRGASPRRGRVAGPDISGGKARQIYALDICPGRPRGAGRGPGRHTRLAAPSRTIGIRPEFRGWFWKKGPSVREVAFVVGFYVLSLKTHTTRPNAARGVSQIPKTTVTGRCGCMVEPPDWCAPLDPSWRAGLNVCVLRQTTQARLVLSSRRTVGCFNGRCICPITLQLMEDPVTTSDGHCYERRSIEDWLRCPWPSSWPCLPALGTLVARAAGRTTRARRQTRSWPTRISYPCEPG